MTDDQTTDERDGEDGDGPDAFVIVHHPADGDLPYGVGPFPPSDELVALVVAGIRCDCRTEVLWLAFPRGLKMGIMADLDEIMEMVREAAERSPAKTDLLN